MVPKQVSGQQLETVPQGGTKEGRSSCWTCFLQTSKSNRTVVLRFEQQQQESDGTLHDVCLTAIPGVDDHTTLKTWNDQTLTVAVSEIMVCLLRLNYFNTYTPYLGRNTIEFKSMESRL